MSVISSLEALKNDREVYEIVTNELKRQRSNVELIASENFASPSVLAASGSVLTNKYSEGYPKRRYYGGNEFIDEAESLAINRAKELFRAEHVNVQPHSGASANLAVYLALVEPGDKILAMSLDQGGHLTHGAKASVTGKLYNFIPYHVHPEGHERAEQIDFDYLRDLARKEQPKLIVAGTSAYARIIDPLPFREIADEVGAYFMFDAAHPMGLIAGGVHPSPVGVADVVTFTTHKTLRGPRSGCIIAKSELAKKIDSAIFPGLQGGPHEHIIVAKAVAFKEASEPFFRNYCIQILKNAKALAQTLEENGFRIISKGTENHQVLIDLRSFDPELDGKSAQEILDFARITCNRNQIPYDTRPPFTSSGLRLGTPAQTTAGMKEREFKIIGELIAKVLRNRNDEKIIKQVRDEVSELVKSFDPYPEDRLWPGYDF